MNQEQVFSLVRQALLVLGGSLVTRGYIDAVTLNAVIGALMILAGAGWAIYTRRPAGLVKSVEALPSIRSIVSTDLDVVAQTGPKVVGSAG